jgi:hypothetical protein
MRVCWFCVALLLALTFCASAQGPACCSITAVDLATGAVHAKVDASGQVFTFQSKQVSLDGKSMAGTITSIGPAPSVHAATPAPSGQPTPSPTPTNPSSKPKISSPSSGGSSGNLNPNTSKVNVPQGTTTSAIRGATATTPQAAPAPSGTDPNVAAAADKLNSLGPQAVPQQTILLGAYDGTSSTFSSALPTQYPAGTPASKQSGQGGPVHALPVADINSFNVTYQVQLHNVPDALRITLVAPSPQGSMTELSATINSSRTLASVSFHPYSGAFQFLKIYVGNTQKSGLEIMPTLRPQLGAFVVPYLLLAVVYEPPGSQSSAAYSTTSSVGTEFSWDFVRSSGLTETTDTSTFLNTLSQVASGAGGVLPGPYGTGASAFGAAVGVINQLQPNTQTTLATSQSTAQSGSTGWSVVQTSSYITGAHQYPGQGDLFVVMKDVLFAYAVVNNKVILAPVKYSVILVDTISQLQNDMPPTEVAKYEALDLMLNPNGAPAVAIRPLLKPILGFASPRLSFLGTRQCPTEGEQQYSIARDQVSSSGLSQSTTQTLMSQVTGMVASMTGSDGVESASVTYTSSTVSRQGAGEAALITLFCPEYRPADNVMVDLYFDTLFGTFLSRMQTR